MGELSVGDRVRVVNYGPDTSIGDSWDGELGTIMHYSPLDDEYEVLLDNSERLLDGYTYLKPGDTCLFYPIELELVTE